MSITKTSVVDWQVRHYRKSIQCDSWDGALLGPDEYHQRYSNTVTYGSNYKDWKNRLAHGIQCTTTLSGTKYSRFGNSTSHWSFSQNPKVPFITCPTHHYLSVNFGIRESEYFPYEFSFPTADTTQMSTANSIALQRFVEQIRAVQTTFQGGVFIGEIGETIRMLSSPAKALNQGLTSYLTSLKKKKRRVLSIRNLKKRLRTAKTVLADTWLEYAFGWKPLIADIHDASKTLANSLNKNSPRWQPVTAVGRDELQSSIVAQSQARTSMGAVFNRYLYTSTKEVRYKGQVICTHPPSNATWATGIFNPNEFIPTVWELIPYSFLVDYFSNIGAIISAASLFDVNLSWAAKTEVEKISAEIVDSWAVPSNSSFFNIAGSTGQNREKRTKTTFSRAPYNGSLVPNFRLQIPGVSTRWINMAALLAGNRALVPFHR